jgi:ornithine decarboxylase
MPDRPEFADVPQMLEALRPKAPVYCISRDRYRAAAKAFLEGFSGRVLYAVKANDDPGVLAALSQAGITHFDCASLPEIAQVKQINRKAICYFMTPVRLRDAARVAAERYGVRHFLVDDLSGLDQLGAEIDLSGKVVFVRMAVRHPGALMNFSNKFGAAPAEVPALLAEVRERGAEPALAFNVGSAVIEPQAYVVALELAGSVLDQLPFRLRLLDMGGGFPLSYPGFEVPALESYFRAIRDVRQRLPLADDGELMMEPGRALAAPGLMAVVEVLLRKQGRLYLNDGMYGIFWELRFHAHDRYAVTVYHRGAELDGPKAEFQLFGPTCDGSDVLPGALELPATIAPGDYLAFHEIGAYSLAGRTRFNGHYSEQVVYLENSPAPGPAGKNH